MDSNEIRELARKLSEHDFNSHNYVTDLKCHDADSAASALNAMADLVDRARGDVADAQAYCGATGGDRDCEAFTSRKRTCSDCPVDWMLETRQALTTIEEL